MKTRMLAIFAAAMMIVGMNAQKASASDNQIFGTIIGAATGAWLGSKVGKGKGNIVAVAVGTLIGAAAGSDISRQSASTTRRTSQPVYQPPQVRRTVKHVHVVKSRHNVKRHKRLSKWQKRQNRKHRRFADARSSRYSGNRRAWN